MLSNCKVAKKKEKKEKKKEEAKVLSDSPLFMLLDKGS